jgi:RNA polymerase sigma-70 factor (ECF subfamily)
VFETLSKGKQIKDEQAFVIGTAKHCLAHYYTAMQRLRARVSLSAKGSDDDIGDIPGSEDIELAVINKDLLDKIFSEICSQSADVQKMFYLHYFMDLPLDETARILKMNENTVRQRLYRAVRLIRRKYTRRKQDD